MGKLVEGLWDCPYCDTTGIKASEKTCPNCGHPQDENTVFRLPDTISYVSDEQATKISRNPDWQCSFCGSLNKDTNSFCNNCGASKEESKKNYFEMRREQDRKKAAKKRDSADEEWTCDFCGTTNKNSHEKCSNCNATNKESEDHFFESETGDSAGTIISGIIGGIVLIGIIAAIIFGLVSFFKPSVKNVTVKDFEWSRSIDIEEVHTHNGSGWSLPSKARLQYTQRELKEYEQVLDHYETVAELKTRKVLDHYENNTSYSDLGNGYFEEHTTSTPIYRTETYTEETQKPVYRQEPVYATKYYYEYDSWDVIDTSTASGNDQNPYWPELSTLQDDQRSGHKNESYIVIVDVDGKEKNYSMSEDEWKTLKKGEQTKLKVSKFGFATFPDSDKKDDKK